MRHVKIATLVALAQGTVLALLGLTGAVALRGFFEVTSAFREATDVTARTRQVLSDLGIAKRTMEQSFALIQIPDLAPELRQQAHDRLGKARFAFDAGVHALDEVPRDEATEKAWIDARRALDAWNRSTEAYADAAYPYEDLIQSENPDPQKLREVEQALWKEFNHTYQLSEATVAPIEALESAVRIRLGQDRNRVARIERTGRLTILIVSGLGLLVTAVLTVFIGRRLRRAIRGLVRETGDLTRAVAEGRLAVRADPDAVQPEFRPVLAGVNEVVDAFARPTAVVAERLTQLADGEAAGVIDEPWAGDFDRMKQSLNALVRVTKQRGHELEELIAAATAGDLDYRADPSKYRGANARLVRSLNEMLDALVSPLRVAAGFVDRIARGDIPGPIEGEHRGEFEVLKRNLDTCAESVRRLVSDVDRLAGAAVQGDLSQRADASRHAGDFRRIVEGVNATLDAVIGPVHVAAQCVESIAQGDLPPPIDAPFAGEFARLRENLNRCIASVQALVQDADAVAQAAWDGRLDVRADLARHQGDFRKIMQGSNRTVDALLAPVIEATVVLERVAAKDLSARVTAEFRGQHARAKEAVNRTAQALQQALSQVATAVDQVSGAAEQIASSSSTVAAGAAEQSAAVGEMRSTIETAAAAMQAASGRADRASSAVDAARSDAGKGAVGAEQLLATMGRIRQSAESTSQIIRDVSDISFQTNLLALNAAVEAARAGDAGRGFAVVAEEVRALALRAKDAAMRTEELIRQSVTQAGEGETVARQVTGMLQQMGGSVAEVGSLVSELAATAQEQAGRMKQAQRTVSDVEAIVQQNAASAEEASAAASELSAQAEELSAMVASFKLEDGAQAGRAAQPKLGGPRGRALPPGPASPR